jgi:putative ABC transport system permease protein
MFLTITNSAKMLTTYFKIALRNLRTHQFFTLLNVLGLALGMSACLTVILILRDQLSFEQFHPQVERTFRVLSLQNNPSEGRQDKYATTPFPLGAALVNDFAVAEKTVRLVRGLNKTEATTTGNLTLPLSGYFTEPSFFEVFGFQLESGNPATALAEPNSLVLDKRAAQRFFGHQNPLGQTLTLQGWGTFRITGVALPPPGKSHIGFECLASANTLAALENAYPPADAERKILGNWNNSWQVLNYVLLRPGKTRADLETALGTVASQHFKPDATGFTTQLMAQNLTQITPAPEMLHNEIGFGLPRIFLWVLAAFGLVLAVFPCLNYANLAVARSLSRAKEVGIRKIVGARDGDLRRLFLTESVLTALLALVVAWVLHFGLNSFLQNKVLSQLNLRGSEPISFRADAVAWVAFVLFGVVVGLLAGWLPARRLAKMRLATALRGGSGLGKMRFRWRTVATVGQFAVSLVFTIVVFTLWSQLRFMALADYGFDHDNLLTLQLQGQDATRLTNEIAQDHRIRGVCASSLVIAASSQQLADVQRERGGEKTQINDLFADRQYVPVMGLQLVAGSNFPAEAAPGHEQFVLLNEKAVSRFALGTPAEAIGKTLWLNDSTPVAVCGVLRDFHFQSLKSAVEPFALRLAPEKCGVLQIRLAPGDPAPALASIQSIWNSVDAVHPLQAQFMAQEIREAYSDVDILGGFIGFFALLSLSLACLGLLGMVTYTVSTKVKEIGIRKVVGASVGAVVWQLSRRFLLLLGVAVGVAVPAGVWVSNFFLNFFAYHTTVGVAVWGSSVLLLLLFGLLAVGVQTVRAALANPVQSLRSE